MSNELIMQTVTTKIKTGDTVLHRPSGEHWLVAGVDGDRLMWCGWPEGSANLSDCELINSCDAASELSMLHELADMSSPDMRRRFAIRRLTEIGDSNAQG